MNKNIAKKKSETDSISEYKRIISNDPRYKKIIRHERSLQCQQREITRKINSYSKIQI